MQLGKLGPRGSPWLRTVGLSLSRRAFSIRSSSSSAHAVSHPYDYFQDTPRPIGWLPLCWIDLRNQMQKVTTADFIHIRQVEYILYLPTSLLSSSGVLRPFPTCSRLQDLETGRIDRSRGDLRAFIYILSAALSLVLLCRISHSFPPFAKLYRLGIQSTWRATLALNPSRIPDNTSTPRMSTKSTSALGVSEPEWTPLSLSKNMST
jgi:hypothetical protein